MATADPHTTHFQPLPHNHHFAFYEKRRTIKIASNNERGGEEQKLGAVKRSYKSFRKS
ncbi:MAG: hypothetical protein WKF84_26790 [Pyrinomonadaceae bacterium]